MRGDEEIAYLLMSADSRINHMKKILLSSKPMILISKNSIRICKRMKRMSNLMRTVVTKTVVMMRKSWS